MVRVRIPLETCIFILNFSLPPRSEQVSGAHVNEIKHNHSPVVIVVLDPRYDLSYKALYIYSRRIAFRSTISVGYYNFGCLLSIEIVKTEIVVKSLFNFG